MGKYSTIGGLESYSVGEEHGDEKLIVIITDIYGHKLINTQLVADQLAKLSGIQVIIPDILKGDAIEDLSKVDFDKWRQDHSPEVTKEIVHGFLQKLKEERKPKKLFGIGYCFGAKFAIAELSENGLLDAAAGAHPSFVTAEDIEEVRRPLLINVGDIDVLFTEDIRSKTIEIASAKKGVYFELALYKDVPHGYAVRGDLSKPYIKYAKEKTLTDQVCFFTHPDGPNGK